MEVSNFDFSDILPLCEDSCMKKTTDHTEDVMIDSEEINNMYRVIAECLVINESAISIDKAEFVKVGGKDSKDYFLLSGKYWDGEEKEFKQLRYYPSNHQLDEKDLIGDVLIR